MQEVLGLHPKNDTIENSFYNVAVWNSFRSILQYEYLPINELLKTVLQLKIMTDMVSQDCLTKLGIRVSANLTMKGSHY